MRHPLRNALGVLLLAALIGCASARHERRGDEAMALGRPDEAVRHYRLAAAVRIIADVQQQLKGQ